MSELADGARKLVRRCVRFCQDAITSRDIEDVTRLLGREPRGLRTIPIRTASGEPVVLQVASLVNDKPFPTLFWLVNPQLNLAIDRLEATGVISLLQQKLDAEPIYQHQLADAHRAHIQLRSRLMTDKERRRIQQLGFESVFEQRGIGGIENFNRIRCLHTYYAAHLISPNLIGQWLEALIFERSLRNGWYFINLILTAVQAALLLS